MVDGCFDCAFSQSRESISAKDGISDGLGKGSQDDGSFGDVETFEEVIVDEVDVFEECSPAAPGATLVFRGWGGNGLFSCSF